MRQYAFPSRLSRYNLPRWTPTPFEKSIVGCNGLVSTCCSTDTELNLLLVLYNRSLVLNIPVKKVPAMVRRALFSHMVRVGCS